MTDHSKHVIVPLYEVTSYRSVPATIVEGIICGECGNYMYVVVEIGPWNKHGAPASTRIISAYTAWRNLPESVRKGIVRNEHKHA